MTTIYLVRHAEAEGNLCRRIHGHFDTNITPNGMKQIHDLQQRFSDIHVDACYCSDLTRTRTTAQAIYLQKGLPLQADSAFREVYLGSWEDLPFGYLYTRQHASIDAFSHHPQLWSTDGSETFEEYTARFITAMEKAIAAHQNETIAIVSHGAVLRGILHVLFPNLAVTHADNTAVTCLTWNNGIYHLEYLNDNSHLNTGRSLFETQHWWKANATGDDGTLWFQEGSPCLSALPHNEAQIVFTALSGEDPVGYVCLDIKGTCGELVDLGLLPAYRGRNLSIQLLGQALFTCRAKGLKTLELRMKKQCEAVACLCRKLFFEKKEDIYTLDLGVHVIPLI